jgi:hypothetical protein
MGAGYDVVNIGLATTPTTELAVQQLGADGGIIITASHNPRQWNALKLLNREGEFLTAADGAEVLAIAEKEDFEYADVDHLGHYINCDEADQWHIDDVLGLELVDREAISKAHFRVCVDAINSVGAVILPKLLEQLGVSYTFLNKEPNGDFAHNPEPLEKNLTGIADMSDRPGAVFVVDVCREANAVKEAVRLGIPVVAIVDTNADPDPIEYVIPGNDDSARAVTLYARAIADAILEGKANAVEDVVRAVQEAESAEFVEVSEAAPAAEGGEGAAA